MVFIGASWTKPSDSSDNRAFWVVNYGVRIETIFNANPGALTLNYDSNLGKLVFRHNAGSGCYLTIYSYDKIIASSNIN